VLAYDYPLLGLFWTIMIFAFWVMIVFAVIWAFIDNFRRHDHSGWAKAGWTLVIILLPGTLLVGFVIYFLVREPLPYHCTQCGAWVSPTIGPSTCGSSRS